MKRGSRFYVVGLILVLLAPLTWLAWQAQPARSNDDFEPVAEAFASPTIGQVLTFTATPIPSNTALPTPTDEPTATQPPPPSPTAVPTSTRTPRPTATPTSTPTQTPTPVFIADNIDRTCPDPAPLKPEYNRYYVPAQSWPQPNVGGPQHLWLSKPLPGGGRLLFTEWFPYGFDAGGRYLLHNGLDVSEPFNTPVLAMADGTVVVAGDDYSRLYGWRCDWYGHLVVIELDDRWLDQPVYILYGHVLDISVNVGDRVSRGEQVAEVGIGGAATLPHLHFEIRVGTNEFGSTRNPLLWLRPPVTRGVVVGRLIDPQGRPWQGVTIHAFGLSDGTENHTTWSYLGDPQRLTNPDETLAENFVIGDMRPGWYELIIPLQGVEYRAEVEVIGGALSTVEIVTEPLKTATPEPAPTATLESVPEPTAQTES